MTRIIKFRFWNSIAHKFQHPAKYAIDGNGYLLGYDYETMSWDDTIPFSRSCIIAQQYTGVKDIDDTDIYEGDFVECDDDVGGRIYGEVVYDSTFGAFRVVFTDILQRTFYKCEKLKVIGNIFENSNLINSK